ncbi:glycosyltransferase family 2 protein [Butyrivibrio sp. JL13D10]|uniref:glycosyltransferase family 2 protein n=1 Tax=Butyrivibrio sp. JL13D10 TaxID=3236815 RepID=UPI0038B4867D
MKFSVIIPVHNAEKYIREAMDSVLAQELPSDVQMEVLLIENGSGDRSAAICDEYAEAASARNAQIKTTKIKNAQIKSDQIKSAQIKSVHMGKASAYEARQEGVRISTGDWIVFMDADDKVVPCLIDTLNNEIKKYSAEGKAVDVILYNAAELDTPDKKMFGFPFEEGVAYGRDNRQDFHRLMCCGDSLNAMWNKCIKRDLSMESCVLDGRRLNHGEDLLQTAAIIDRAKGIAYLDRILYLYRINEEGLTGSYHEEFMDNQAGAWEAFDNYAGKWCGDKYSDIISRRKTLTCTIGMKKLIYSGLSIREIKKKLRTMVLSDFYKKYAKGELPDWAPEEDVFVHGLQVSANAEKSLMRSCLKHKLKSYIKARIRKNGI